MKVEILIAFDYLQCMHTLELTKTKPWNEFIFFRFWNN